MQNIQPYLAANIIIKEIKNQVNIDNNTASIQFEYMDKICNAVWVYGEGFTVFLKGIPEHREILKHVQKQLQENTFFSLTSNHPGGSLSIR